MVQLREALKRQPKVGVPPTTVHRYPKPRKPKSLNVIAPSRFRPHVLARDRVRLWSAPHSDLFHSTLLSDLPLDTASNLFDVILISVEPKTRENYGVGLLRFHQFCDSISIPEDKRLPASEHLIAAFISSWAGRVAETTADNWLAGLHFWHQINGAHWNGHALLRRAKQGLAKVVPDTSKRPRRPPVTLEHMHTLFRCLDLSNSFDAAVYSTASVAFWSCCRLGELIVPSLNTFDPTRHVSRSVSISHRTTPGGAKYASFHIPWTKTTHGEGDFITVSKIDDPTNPYDALVHHISANTAVPPSAPLFAFETDSGWAPMTRTWFLTRCNNVWESEGLETLSGHCFRIGGATELLRTS
ncbi:DNA breaking-rejoining enzyme [Suillus tomentosus]|nr:DNA breaking-rejoining enzyme [Suillus tomentosus]